MVIVIIAKREDLVLQFDEAFRDGNQVLLDGLVDELGVIPVISFDIGQGFDKVLP